ncbi:hypothetical protein ACIQNU_21375 [Streptomyces sp. NPDC091292]|uniref:hypothetical protein n=1 Tax=Streptomyces sp. NPDC091292 TaxID=3365991 RepID=UPI003828334C
MGWGQRFAGERRGERRGELGLAAAASTAAVQLALVLLFEVVRPATADNYGGGYGGALAGLFLCCVCFVSPAALALAGFLHALALTLPATELARFAERFASRFAGRFRHPAARRIAPPAALVTVALLWAAPLAPLLDLPYATAAAWTLGTGILPMAAAAYATRRPDLTPRLTPGLTPARIWRRAALTCVLLSGAVIGGTLIATHTGLLKEYEPPRLTSAQLTGVWEGSGDDTVVLRLDADGRAAFTDLPYVDVTADSIYGDVAQCDSTATWTLGTDSASERDVVELDPTGAGCPGEIGDTGLTWTIGGTESEPELYVLFGDPDAGDLVILVPRRRPS